MRFEAWTLPWSAAFQRIAADVPAIEGSGRGSIRANVAGDGQLDIPADWDRLDEVISDTVGSLIRVYDGSTLIHEWLAERADRKAESDTITISGPDLKSVVDRTVVYPYDYPTSPSTNGDWIWGGTNQLSNPGLEDSPATPREYELEITATGGTFTITDGTDTTSNINWNDSAATIETRIETDITAITDVAVSTQGGNHFITYVTPTHGVNLSLNVGSLTGGTATLSALQDGGLSPSPWTIAGAINADQGQAFGYYDNFGVSDVVARTGSFSLLVDPGTVYATQHRNPGAQQVINVTPGSLFQASVWLYPTSGTDKFRLGVFGIGEEIVAFDSNGISGGTYTASTWNQITITDGQIPAGVTQVILRVQCTNGPSDPSVFYIDDTSFQEGLAAATVGGIVTALMDDATTDHSGDTRGTILDWLDYSGFDSTNDSSTTAWDDTLSFAAYRGMRYGQVFDSLVDLGYEWRITAKATPGATTHDLEWYNDGGMDAAPAVGLTVGQGPAASVIKRIPEYTAVLVEGDDGVYVEDKDATAETNFGRFEKYSGSNQWADATTLTAAGDHLLSEESTNRTAVKATVIRGDWSVPLVDYTVGDTITFQFPPSLAKSTRRISQITYRNTHPATYQITGSRVFEGEAGAYEAVRRLLRKFTRLEKPPTPIGFGLSGQGTGIPTLVVAASDASSLSLTRADYVCDGVNDDEEIQSALDDLSASGGTVWLTEGTYTVSSAIQFNGAGLVLRGLGWKTIIYQADSTNIAQMLYVPNVDDCEIRDLAIDGNRTNQTSGGLGIRFANAENALVARVKITEMDSHGLTMDGNCGGGTVAECYVNGVDGIGVNIASGDWKVINNRIINCTGVGTGSSALSRLVWVGNIIQSCDIGISTSNIEGTIVGNTCNNNTNDGINYAGQRSVIVGNTCDGNGRYGIRLVGDADSVVVGNVVTANTTGPILYGASTTVIQNNVGDTGGGQGGGGVDTDAIHDNTAAEISAVTAKTTPTVSDYLLIEDAAAADAKKSITLGDIPTRQTITGFGEDDLAASLTNSQLYRQIQATQAQIPVVAAFDGHVVGISVASSEARTAGTATFEVYVNGTGTGLTAVLDATNTQYKHTTQAAGLDTFTAGDRVDVRVTTDGSWTPTTADVEATVFVLSQ